MNKNKEYYYVSNRGVNKQAIFRNNEDFARFIALLFIGNDNRPLPSKWYKEGIWDNNSRNNLVSIIAYCVDRNGFKLIVEPLDHIGLSKFIHKISTSYVMYYNRRYSHRGTVFEGIYKSVCLKNENELSDKIKLIHSKKSRYSSFKDYCGEIRLENEVLSIDENLKNKAHQ